MSDLPPEELVKALRAKRQVLPVQGGGTMSSDGGFSSYITDDGMRLVNPDGPQAAALIERLEAERDEWTIERAVGQRQLDELSARVTELEGAAHAFLAKWDECKPHIDDAFLHRQLRCGPYTGPELGEELYALRKASKYLAQGEG